MNMTIGAYIKQIRKTQQITLKELADKTEFSTGYLSLLERGLNNPTIDSLHRICKALNTTLADMFIDLEEDKKCVKKGDRKTIFNNPGCIRYDMVTEGKGLMTAISMILQNDRTYSSGMHISDEIGIVTQGAMKITIEGVEYCLEEGDSIYIAAGNRHSFCKTSQCECISYWVSPTSHYENGQVFADR